VTGVEFVIKVTDEGKGHGVVARAQPCWTF
jgi:hypothetical protein